MPKFTYSAISQDGKRKSGIMEARNKEEIAKKLRTEGYILVLATPAVSSLKRSVSLGKYNMDLSVLMYYVRGIPLVERMMFARHLSVMIKAGLSLSQSLEILARQSEDVKFKSIISDIAKRIQRGDTLADSLARYPRAFNELFVNMVRTGELGGNLDDVLKILARQMKKDHELRSRVRSAMMYPTIVLIAMVGIAIFMMLNVIPKISETFEEVGVELPVQTQIVISLSDALVNHYILFFAGSLLSLALIIYFFRTKPGKKVASWILLHTPQIKSLTKKVNSARFARTFGSLMESGIPVVESLNVAGRTLSNYYYRDALVKTAISVQKGVRINDALMPYENLFPILVIQMIGVGEETGTINDILKKLASFYESEVSITTKALSGIIEPILMIIMGLAVGFFAVSMIQPMYSLVNAI